MKQFISIAVFFVLIATLNSQSLYHNFAVSSITIETGSTNNVVNLKVRWNDGSAGQVSGISSLQFEITSAFVSISDVQLHPSLTSNFFMRKFAITNGYRVLIYGQNSTKMLKDNGTNEAAYLTAQIIFNAPASEGSGTMTLTNTDAVSRITTSPYTPSSQNFSNSNDVLNISVSTSISDLVPVFSPGGGYGSGVRKYGDINWDGYIDISDITALADVLNANYQNVIVLDAVYNFDPPAGANNRYFYQSANAENPITYNASEDPDKADAVAADVYRSGSDPVPPANAPLLNGMDLNVLMDAVLNGYWPAISIPALSNKPAYKTNGDGGNNLSVIAYDQNRYLEYTENTSIKYEIFNEGKINSKIRLLLTNNSSTVKGIQINLNLDKAFMPLNYNIYNLRNAEGLRIYWTKKIDNSFNIIILPANQKYLKQMTNNPILTIDIPYFKSEFINDNVSFILVSENNLTAKSNFEVKQSSIFNLPAYFELHQNYPNPFNASTRILVDIPEYSKVRISIYDMLGREVAILADEIFDPGRHHIDWNATNFYGDIVSSGNYIVLFKAASLENNKNYTITRKIVFLK